MSKRKRHRPARPPANEDRRLDGLQRYGVLDTAAEQSFDDLTTIAALICETPISAISLVDRRRVWFKSRIGVDAVEAPRELAFCGHAILQPNQLLVIADALDDDRFADNPLVQGEPNIRFYAGAPLVTPDGLALGTLCVMDRRPRELAQRQRDALAALSRQAVTQLELRRTLALTTASSLTDPLTGAGNRRAFDLRIAQEWSRLARTQRPLAVLLADIDHFKRYNDRHGHPAGDAVLRRLVTVVAPNLRAADLLVRWGGEEFAMLVPDTDAAGAVELAERLRAAVEGATWPHRGVTVSLGVTTGVPSFRGSPGGLLAEADQALYVAKRRGRNRVVAWAAGAAMSMPGSDFSALEIA